MKKIYSEEYDAYYDEDTNEWLEEVCGDSECEYCKNRPKRPMETECLKNQKYEQKLLKNS